MESKGKVLQALGDNSEALQILEEAARLSKKAGDGKTSRAASMAIAIHELWSARLDSFEKLCKEILSGAGEGEPLVDIIITRLPYAMTVAGRFREARELVEKEIVATGKVGSPQREAACIVGLGLSEHHAGNLDEARRCFKKALSIRDAFGPRTEKVTLLLLMARLEAESCEFEAAWGYVKIAEEEARLFSDPALEHWQQNCVGIIFMLQGRLEDAISAFELATASDRRIPLVDLLTSPLLGLGLALADRLQESEDVIARLKSDPGNELVSVRGVLELAEAALDLQRARSGSSAMLGEAIMAVSEKLKKASSTQVEVRIASRVLVQSMENLRPLVGELGRIGNPCMKQIEDHGEIGSIIGASESSVKSKETLFVSSDSSCFHLVGMDGWVDLQRRGAIRRVFNRLVDESRSNDPRPVDVETLISIGWPSEQVGYESGVLRVYSAIAALRRLGLKNVLETVDDGYRLAKNLAIFTKDP